MDHPASGGGEGSKERQPTEGQCVREEREATNRRSVCGDAEVSGYTVLSLVLHCITQYCVTSHPCMFHLVCQYYVTMWRHVCHMWRHVCNMCPHVATCVIMWQHVSSCANMCHHGHMWQHVCIHHHAVTHIPYMEGINFCQFLAEQESKPEYRSVHSNRLQ